MKKILIVWMGICAFFFYSFIPAQTEFSTTKEVEDIDSTLAVIAYFNKHDTLVYWISEAEWSVNGEDTVRTSGVWTKVMVTVTDSTKKGYAMEYRFLAFEGDSTVSSEIGDSQNQLVRKLSEKLVGTTIRFRTDECGQILRYDNLKGIKKQAKALFKEACDELMQLPLMDSLRMIGLDMTSYLKYVDMDELVKGYVEELELLFQCHGYSYELGQTQTSEEATEDQYASDSYTSVEYDAETGDYELVFDVNNNIPREEVKDLLRALMQGVKGNDELTSNFEQEFDKQVKDEAVLNTYFRIKYFPEGWPSEVVSQTNWMIGNRGKLKQTYIRWDYISTCN